MNAPTNLDTVSSIEAKLAFEGANESSGSSVEGKNGTTVESIIEE